ncbi:MAG: PQQ-dependent sugar dehydrogenase [Bacteroidia bacterium]
MKKSLTTLLLFAGLNSFAQTGTTLNLEVVSSGQTNVTTITNCGDERVFVTLQAGTIQFFSPYGGTSGTFLNITSQVNSSGNERGLLGLAFAPDYAESGHFYVNYTATGGATRISRFTVSAGDPNVADAGSEQILLTISQPFSNHNGGNIVFGPDGYLYIGMGDGGSGGDPNNNAQNNQSLLGKMLRIDVSGGGDYSIPADNPFYGDNDPNNSVLDEIWAKGVRNPWRFSFDRLTGDLWIGDVGQNIEEEVNFQPASSAGGENYGWRCYEGNLTYNTSGCQAQSNYVFPIFTYDHSTPNGCSITGGFVYRGTLTEELYGRYIVTDYCSGRIWSILQEDETTFSSLDHGQYTTYQYSTFGEDMYGELYLGRQNGQILRVGIANAAPLALASSNNNNICPGETVTLSAQYNPELSYQWTLNGEDIEGAVEPVYETGVAGDYQVRVTNSDLISSTSDAITISVAPAPPVLSATAAQDSLCEDQAFGFSLEGSPAGGTFSGTGVDGDLFQPFELGAGTYTVTYNYTTTEGCASEPFDFDIVILPLPEAEILGIDEFYCSNIDIAIMPELNPPGGSFYGDGVENGVFSPSSASVGEVQLNYTYADEFGCGVTVSVFTNVEDCTGIEESSVNQQPVIFPNPVSNAVHFRLPADEHALSFRLFSASGKLVFECSDACIPQSMVVQLPETLAAGNYLFELRSDKQVYSNQLIKK